jgi:predicted ATPase
MRRLLAGLVAGAGSVVPVDRLAETLWGDQPPVDPTGAVHNLVSRLRTVLRSAGCGAAVRIVTRPPGYLLVASEGALDCDRFVQLVSRARDQHRDSPGLAAALLDEALALWRGPAYGEFAGEGFAAPDAVRLEEIRWGAMADRVDAALALGRPDEAIGLLEPLLAAQPLSHRPRGQLMLALHRAGRSAQALEAFRDYRELLADELGLDPPPELGALETAILRRDPAIEQARPASSPGNLPHRLTELVGRAEDARRVTSAMAQSRLVTLTGVGGVGKTRLALHVAAELIHGCLDGAWLCELAGVGDEAVATALATALDVQQRDAPSVTSRLVGYLRTKGMLIVLDNCEHVLTAVAQLADALLGGCPGVRLLATSREPLGIEGEQVLPVAPLAPPDAVTLFIQRATAACPSFTVTSENAAEVTEVCRRLDGLPLALELVAPKIRSLSARDIVARLERRLQFVRTASQIREQRHRTLHAVVDWSYQLLAEPQRQVFDRLSVFASSFTMAAAQQVAGCGGDAEGVAEAVTALVDRSMLGAHTDDPPSRYTMLDTLRHYGRERLDARGWAAETRLEHARYQVELAEAAFTGLTGADPGAWSATIDRHLDDLRAAHRWSVQHEPDLATRLAAALYWYVEAGSSSEVALWAERSLAVTASSSRSLLPVVFGVAAWGASKRGDLPAAVELAHRGLAAAADRDPVRRYALFVLGDVALFEGRLHEASRYYEEVARLAGAAGDTYCHGYAMVNSVLPLAYGSGDPAAAVAAARRVRSVTMATGSPSLRAWADYALGEALAGVDAPAAITAIDAALVTARQCRNRFMEGIALLTAASLRARQGDPRAALPLFGQVIEHWQRAGNWTQQWITIRNVIEALARVGADEPAAILCGALNTRRSSPPLFGADAERLAGAETALRASLGEQHYLQCQARGAAMTDLDAITFAAAACTAAS